MEKILFPLTFVVGPKSYLNLQLNFLEIIYIYFYVHNKQSHKGFRDKNLGSVCLITY